MTSRSARGSFEKQCGTSFYHKDWNIENKNIVSRRFIVKTSLDKLDKIVKNQKYNTTVSYCQGCIDYVSLNCTECGRSKFTEDKGFQTEIFPLSRSVESQTEGDTYLQGIQNLSYTRTILKVRNSLIILLET